MSTSRTGTTKYLYNAARIKAEAQALGITRCPRCGHPMDYTRGSRSPWRATVDHRVPYATMRRLGRLAEADDMDNLRTVDGQPNVMCQHCNSSLSDKRTQRVVKPFKTTTTTVAW